jgi:hypothetical protein
MSVTGYFGKTQRGLGMEKGRNHLGIVFHGAVLEGERSVEDEMKMDAARGAVQGFWARRRFYSGVEKYDPVLRWHCRL